MPHSAATWPLPSKHNDLSVIIVNWNTKALLLNCLSSLLPTLADMRVEVFVVDNASSDGSIETVRHQFPDVITIANEENTGFAAGNNRALAEAHGKHILLLNPDTLVTEKAVELLYQVLESCPHIGIVGSQLINEDGSLQVSEGYFPDIWSEIPLLKRYLSKKNERYSISTSLGNVLLEGVDWVSGACLMIRSSVIEQIGVLDEDYWMYTEETDWCFRAQANGWQVAKVHDARVVHFQKAASRQKYLKTMLHYYQSRIVFIKKNRGEFQSHLARLVFLAKSLVWLLFPSISPLAKAYTDLETSSIRKAYRVLFSSLIFPHYIAGID